MKNRYKKNQPVAVVILILITFLSVLSITCYDFLSLAPYQQVSVGEQSLAEKSNAPLKTQISSKKGSQQALGNDATGQKSSSNPEAGDKYDVELFLGESIPLKKVTIQEIDPVYVIPGGQAVGVLLQTNGVTVVGQSPVIKENDEALYPAKEAGLEIGDFITSINGTKVNSNQEVADLINDVGTKGEKLTINLIRDKKEQQIIMTPAFCSDSKSYRIGIYVRDNTAGVGTMTFYEPQSGKYGALGHEVSDLDGKGTTEHDKGIIVKATIQGIRMSTKDITGEKIGSFMKGPWRGSIEKNCKLGVFGRLKEGLENPFFTQALPVALADQVELGDAEIYTVLEGEKIEKFSIKIVKILPNYRSSGKGMIIEVADPSLLQRTGGIIQGMSGSPIIQNDHLVGAVTHVFINKPHKGYACFAEWMLEEADLLTP
ncbi:MAG: SpoIVB peptidase [Bacillota bacterium]|jgi:stage IV sporulation protein B